MLVNGDGYLLIELLAHLVAPGTELTLTEMLPAPDQLWLQGSEGGFCAELRLGFLKLDQSGSVPVDGAAEDAAAATETGAHA